MGKLRPVLVSACLLGINCRYDGTNHYQQAVIDYLAERDLQPVPICPEQLGGLPTPRAKVWFTKGDGRDFFREKAELIDEKGMNPAAPFLRGAQETLQIARRCQCQTAILKERSPSCGSNQIHRNGKLTDGVGITCALLQQEGLDIFSEENLS